MATIISCKQQLITPVRAAWPARASPSGANRSPQPKTFVNAPSAEGDGSFPDMIRVLDRRHPFYGRSLRVLGLYVRRSGNLPPSYVVEGHDGTKLHVPILAAQPATAMENPSKLSVEALLDLISLAEQLEDDGDCAPGPLADAACCPAATDRGERRGRSDGGRS